MAELNVNGISSQLDRSQQRDEKTYQQFNGVHSSQSSRSSSPSVRLGQISSSHLPVNRPIPQSQLPPSHFPPNTITQQMSGLNLRQTVSYISPKYSTSTPNVQSPENITFPSVSPVARPKTNVSVTSVVPHLIQTSQQSPGMEVSNSSSQQIRNVNNGPISESQPVNLTPSVSSHFGQQNVPPAMQQIIPPPIQQNTAPPHRNILHQKSVQPSLPSQPNIQSKPLYKQLSSQMPPTSVQTMPNQSYPPAYLLQNQQNVQRLPQTSENDLNKKTTEQAITQHNSPMNNFNTNIGLQPKPPMGNSMMPPSSSMPPMSQPFHPPTYQSNAVNSFSGGPPPISNATPLVGNIPPTQKTSLFSNRYPSTQQQLGTPQFSPHQQQYVSASQQQPQQQAANMIYQQSNYNNQQPQYNVTQSGFNKLWGHESYDLLQTPNILPPTKIEAPNVYLGSDILDQANCSPDIFHCTMTKIPENNSLLQKSRLPLGVLIHPFRDLSHLPVIQCNVIVRCRACRTYINPFVTFVDNKRWKCNLCYRINELPEEFQYDPVSKTYGDPSRRPEIKSSTLEYIAPAEYMLRPPQPAVYLYLLDVSRLAVESGYLQIFSNILLEELKNIPGDARTLIGFIAFDSAVHFYCFPDGITQPQEMTVLDIDEIFLPTPDNLLVNLRDRTELIIDLLSQLPNRFANTFNTNSALGAALQAAYKMMGATGGRVTVFQASLPNIGPGALTAREDPSQRTSVEVAQLNPVNDFYKRLALECSGQQIAVDIFIVNSQYVDIATLSGISRFSGGCIHHFPLLRPTKPLLCEEFARSFRRYLTRKIGFEAVMRIRCTRGLSIHTFHGNFFVRSTDLLSLPNINPDAGFGMQVAIEESLSDVQSVCFQAALLYTSSKGERRIRVHTMCLPVASTLHDIIHSADQQCIVGLLAKMAVDRSMQSSLSDAREAFINVAIDILSSYKLSLNLGSPNSGLLAPNCLRLLPLYISALLKHTAFRVGSATKIDDRVMAMVNMKTKPLYLLIQQVYPDLYPIHDLESQQVILNTEEEPVPMPPRIQLTARCLENKGVFLMDMGEQMLILVCPNAPLEFLNEALGVTNYNAIPDEMYDIPILDNPRNQRLHQFINYLNEDKPYVATVRIIRDNSSNRLLFFERLIEDRVENALSYHEFLQHLKTQVK